MASEYILIGVFLLCNLVILNGFQSLLTDSMHVRNVKGTFRNLNEFVKSGIRIKLQHAYLLKNVLLESYHSDLEDMMQRIIMPKNDAETVTDIEEAINEGFAILSLYRKASYLVSENAIKNNGTTLLLLENIIPELQRPLGYIIDKRLKILPNINKHLEVLIHSGIYNKWYDDFVNDFVKIRTEIGERKQFHLNLFLNDFHTIFWFQILGILISTIVFFIEILAHYIKNKFRY